MELNTKVKELEDELKVLKAEIRNVLLDIREVILDRTNPLAEEHQSAFIRMDLNTTARALASEVGAREAAHASEHVARVRHRQPREVGILCPGDNERRDHDRVRDGEQQDCTQVPPTGDGSAIARVHKTHYPALEIESRTSRPSARRPAMTTGSWS